MNLKQLSSRIGNLFRLRPLPIRRGADGASLGESDDQWRLEETLENPNRLKLVNIHTHHVVELGSDNVREYRSPDFLLLTCHLLMTGYTVSIEPIVPQTQVPAAVPAGGTTVQVKGDALRLLEYCVTREQTRLFDFAEADEAIAALQLTPEAYRDAAEELAYLGLVVISPNGNHATGIARTMLHPPVFLAVAQQFFPDDQISDELKELFSLLKSTPREQTRVRVPELLKTGFMPLPHLDLVLRGLEEMGYIVGHGPGHHDWGSYLDIEITTKGRRMLKGDEPFPYL